MSLSVVIPVFNDRDHLAACLDGLAAQTTDIETIVVNGPSTDGTSGMLHERTDVDVLLESASRNLNVARNAGIREASHPIIALLAPAYRIQEHWQRTIEESLAGAADAASGPIEPTEGTDEDTESTPDPGELAIHGGNLAMTRGAVTALDGFDEYLSIDGTSDLAHRLSGLGLQVVWHPEMRVQLTATPDGGRPGPRRCGHGADWEFAAEADWGLKYRSLTYRQVKNAGAHPRVLRHLLVSAIRDGVGAARDVLRGQGTPSEWVGNGMDVVSNVIVGVRAGFDARRADGTSARNPNGLSQSDTAGAVAVRHDWRE